MPTIRLLRHALSGHCHRVELFLSLLGVPYECSDIDLLRGEQRSPQFRAKNPFGQVPVLEHDGEVIADSNAILVYLALRYDPEHRYLPREPGAAARVQRWLSVAAGELVNGPGACRLAVVFGAPIDRERAEKISTRLLSLLNSSLADQPFLAADRPTLADIALYTYTAHAPEGGVSLEPYPHVRSWLARIEALPGFVGMQRTPPAVS
ncbi:MAG TPA: glutathione S-transferase [Polyangiales bacterium]|nr:glutathione S-transferase [Polyangiales bacterium]